MITIKDIARAASVNHSTVSRALRDDPRVSAAMREKIHAIARQMNYVPNLAARKLVRQKTISSDSFGRRRKDCFSTI
ncbi:LacI family DNA-binding transcriptional regulator [Paenibacillus hemerocallicola]|nr:LacI family DNA-binding transcriptional regulator [Paenibacillus hemerocallicola]